MATCFSALAHSRPDAAIRIRAARVADGSAAAEDGLDVELTVEDGGPGMPAAVLEHAFDKFYRGHGVEAGSRHGLGIGLTVARGLTEAMGARISASASDLGGLAITFRLAGGE